MSQTRKKPLYQDNALFIVAVVACTFAYVVHVHAAPLTMKMWNAFHVFPELVTFFHPDNAELAISIGYYKFNTFGQRNYDLDEAERYLWRALELDPMASTAWHQLARIDFLRGDLDAAIAKSNKQIELHGDEFFAAYYVRGLTYAFRGQYAKAEADFLTFLEHKPQSWAANNDLAWIYFRQGKYQEAGAYAARGLEQSPDNPWLLNMYGLSLLNEGSKDEAKEVFTQALAAAQTLTKDDWVIAYPGNNPADAEQGLAEMKAAIEANIELVD